MNSPPPYGIIPYPYMQIGNFRQPSLSRPSADLVMGVRPHPESSYHHSQNVAMYAQPSPRFRPPPSHGMGVQRPGVYPHPPRGY